ncbi:hypothetical protein HPB50_017863 [Hyalomma asiaticum]|uniref:Uncharacterized protein n=1 Tax=Hyalomma asiaticum TaxID=266040 RepID=A0ACB7S9X4_HYAAI|nr:hypothetical protein HPB50_017863 [Hyalomma asiaticum]
MSDDDILACFRLILRSTYRVASCVPDWLGQHPLHSMAASNATQPADETTDLDTHSVDSFDPLPPPDLVCGVCRGVYQNPVECPCRHIFCHWCIRTWLDQTDPPGP